MTTYNNIVNFKSTAESYIGDLFNIAHDGSAIALGSEPSIAIADSLDANWTIELIFRSSAITEQCLLSIDDGAGGRYLDVVQRDGDKIVVYYEGVETTVTYTHAEWNHVVFGYNASTNTLGLGCNTLLTFVEVTDHVTIPAGRLIRFFRPVHTEDYFFDGHIETYRVSKFYRTEFFNFNPYRDLWYNPTLTARWVANGGNVPSVGFTGELLLEATIDVKISTPPNRYHSFCKFDSNRILACQNQSRSIGYFDPLTEGYKRVGPGSAIITSGMHYFARNNTVLMVNGNAGNTLQKIFLGSETLETVSSDGTYFTCRGDPHDRYLFGWKQTTEGIHQIFRTDHNGLNEITVDTATLSGVNHVVTSLSVDPDNDRLFFLNLDTFKLNCVDFDLASNYTAFSASLNNGWGGTEYSNGYVYYAGIGPSGARNEWIWRYDVANDEFQRFDGVLQPEGGNQPGLFVDKNHDRLVIYAFHNATLSSTDVSFGQNYMALGARTSSSVNISWVPIDSAVGYNLYQNGALILSGTTETSFQATGLTTPGEYEFTLEYTTDGTSFVANNQYRIFHFPTPGEGYFFAEPSLSDYPFTRMVDWADPYTAEDILYGHGDILRRYNIATGTNTLVTPNGRFGDGKFQSRAYANKSIYIRTGTRVRNAGIELANMASLPNANTFVGGTQNVIFDNILAGDTDGLGIEEFVVSLDGTKIYYTNARTEVWGYDRASGMATLVTNDTNRNLRGIDLDPLDDNSLVYSDNGTLMHVDLATGVLTEIAIFIGNTSNIRLLGGVVYGASSTGAYFRVNVDGTNREWFREGGVVGSDRFTGIHLDTINKRILLFQQGIVRVVEDATIADLPSDPSLFVVTPSPISFQVVWQETPGATSYSLRYTVGVEGESDDFITAVSSTTNLRHTIRNLPFASPYTLYLYYSTNSAEPSILIGSATHFTLENTAGNYDRAIFDNGTGRFDLSGYSATSLDALDEVLNDIFDTGDEIDLDIGSKTTRTRFVRRGGATAIEDGDALAFGFVSSAGAGQSATLTLSDSSNVTVEFDETTEQLTIGGNAVTSGQSIVLDGRKVTVVDI